MNSVSRTLSAFGLMAALAAPVLAAQTPTPPPAPQAPQPPAKPDPVQKYEETLVVSASRTEQKVVDAPSTMSVITGMQIEMAPSQNFAELLRTIPGVNITQVSARDINITSRAATGTLATGQLALLDGRSLYQDFFGFVMWDFLPVNLNEVKQIEVIRGPASAVWGANAVSGVVNVITKSPREMPGSSAVLGFGTFDRTPPSVAADAGSLWYVSGTHARAINDRWAFKLSAGAYSQDALARPTGVIPGGPGTLYPAYENAGTTQPKFDARVDYDYPDGRKLTFSGGIAGTEGIMHSGIGPFDIESGSTLGYGRVNFTRKGMRASAFLNVLNGEAANLLTRTPQNAPITFDFATNKISDQPVVRLADYDFSGSLLQVRSLGRHWSAGARLGAGSSTFRNQRLGIVNVVYYGDPTGGPWVLIDAGVIGQDNIGPLIAGLVTFLVAFFQNGNFLQRIRFFFTFDANHLFWCTINEFCIAQFFLNTH